MKRKYSEIQCPYSGCRLHCSSRQKHRAKYAGISYRWKKKVEALDTLVKAQPSPRINYEALKKILWPLNEEHQVDSTSGSGEEAKEK